MNKTKTIILLVVISIFASVFAVNAASFINTSAGKQPVSITYKDIARFTEIASKVRGKKAYIVNATEYKGNNDCWIVRLSFGEESDRCEGDFAIHFYPYFYDQDKKKVTSLPFKNEKEGTAIFGPCWYYFGIFDDKTYDICGYAIAERIKRWPSWNDYSFFGKSFRGIFYDGNYTEKNDFNFIENHIKK